MNQPPIKSLPELLAAIAANAETDRLGTYLEIAAEDYPQISGPLLENLDAPPGKIIDLICQRFPMAYALKFLPHTESLIARLQVWFKERGY